jgi:hypothetical protein
MREANCNFDVKQRRAKPSIRVMSIEKTIIEELDAMAQTVIKAEDMPRWANTKELLSQRLSVDMNETAQAALQQLRRYDGRDFIFEVTVSPIDTGVIVYFKLGDMSPNIPAYVHARHEYSGKWKYDLTIAVMQSDGWHITRIYNIESKWLTMI